MLIFEFFLRAPVEECHAQRKPIYLFLFFLFFRKVGYRLGKVTKFYSVSIIISRDIAILILRGQPPPPPPSLNRVNSYFSTAASNVQLFISYQFR